MQRPLSPHLQIYSPQLTSVLSILHRLTGLGFTVGLILTCAWLFALSVGPVEYNNFCGWLSQPFVKTIIYLILASIYYHMLNGIRYLVWSLGKGFELSSVYYSGWIVCSLVLVLTVLTVFFI
jgi:succinate dehydrogenase / fumarate reductase cytochrome b subunit